MNTKTSRTCIYVATRRRQPPSTHAHSPVQGEAPVPCEAVRVAQVDGDRAALHNRLCAAVNHTTTHAAAWARSWRRAIGMRAQAPVQARLPFPRTSFPPGRPCPTIRSQRECGNHRISVHRALFCPHTTASSVREGHSKGAVRDGGRLTVLSVSCRSPLSFSSSFTALSLSASPRKLALAYRASRHVLPQPASPTTTRLTLLFCAREQMRA